MDKKEQSTDKLLSDVYKQFEGDSQGQEIKFLNTVFSFLNRRSTFLGKPGVSKQIVQMVHNHINTAKKHEMQSQQLNQKKTSGITSQTKKSISEKEAIKLDEKEKEKEKTDSKNKNKKEKEQKKESEKMEVDKNDKDNDTEVDRIEIDENTVAPPGNGGTTDKYVWTQTLSELEMRIDIDANLRGRNLKVIIQKRHLFAAIKGKESTPIINGNLFGPIDVEESTWLIDKEQHKNTKTLTITLTKLKGMNWWECVIVGDPKIDTRKIQPENSKLDDLDDETRQTVEKMMFDQRQKMKGLPTSKELEQQKILEKFKQQHPEMDFSNVKMG